MQSLVIKMSSGTRLEMQGVESHGSRRYCVQRPDSNFTLTGTISGPLLVRIKACLLRGRRFRALPGGNMAALFVLALAVVGAAASTTTERPQGKLIINIRLNKLKTISTDCPTLHN